MIDLIGFVLIKLIVSGLCSRADVLPAKIRVTNLLINFVGRSVAQISYTKSKGRYFMSLIKPSQIDTSYLFLKNIFDDVKEKEEKTVMGNIIIFSQNNDDEWKPFSFEDYNKMFSKRIALPKEEIILDRLVNKKFLSKEKGFYSKTELFISTVITVEITIEF